ncbi:MAG: hypothetical protein Phog2KO_12330 [Phototrophicaceae bacterium]
MRLHRIIVGLLLLVAVPIMAQDEPVSPSELELSGTPTAICESATPAVEPENRTYTQALPVLEADVDYRAIICTSAGAIYLDLLEDYTPDTVNNFVFLAEQNYYNNTTFHRVMEDFMAQAGDPTGTGAGGPGYQFADEFVGFITFDRPGLLAMANSGPATNGSQFFITTAETPWLSGVHTIFGEVLEGQEEVVNNILIRDPQAGGEATTLDTVVIIRDPELVDSTYEDTTEVATQETFVEGINLISQTLPEDIAFAGAEILTTEDVASFASEDLSDDYAEFLANYEHDYRVSALLENTNCNTDYFFSAMSYSVDAFADADAASNALADDFLPSYYEAIGYTAIEVEGANYQAYRTDAQQCAEGEVIITLDVQRGRYIANISVIFASDMITQFSEAELAGVVATNIATLFEQSLVTAYQSELR